MPRTTKTAAKPRKKAEKTAKKTPDQMRDAILDATLAHVPFDGWSAKAVRAGAVDAGVTEAFVRLAFSAGSAGTGGVKDMVKYYLGRLDERMVATLAKKKLGKMRIRERISTAIKARLALNSEDREVVRRTLTWASMPGNADVAARALWRTADAIWRAAGDTATDYNHYTKRLMLAGVYLSTLLVWLQDESEDFADTDAFLERRIDDVMKFEKVKAQVRDKTGDLPDIARFLGKLRYPEARR